MRARRNISFDLLKLAGVGALALSSGISATGLLAGSALAQAPTTQIGRFRTVSQQPFAADSFWNTPLGQGAAYQSDSGLETRTLRDENVGGPGGSYAWIEANVFTIYRQKATDPITTWTYASRPTTIPWPTPSYEASGIVDLRTPPGIAFSGNDQYAVIISDDGRYAYEIWKGSYDPSTRGYRAQYMVRTDLLGPGKASRDGISEGVRAFGGSLLGGLVRCHELNSRSIPHAIAVVLSPTQLKAGRTMYEQKVWPATVTDNNGANAYSGNIPMGALVAIPPSVNLDALGLSPEGLALARAYQTYGGYVVDAATKTHALAAVETGCGPEPIQKLQQDKRKILRNLVLILNNSEASPGGPGPRVTQPPPAPIPYARSLTPR